MDVIKVAIADDHKIFRKGVILSLRPFTNIKFVQEAENGDELLNGVTRGFGQRCWQAVSGLNAGVRILELLRHADDPVLAAF